MLNKLCFIFICSLLTFACSPSNAAKDELESENSISNAEDQENTEGPSFELISSDSIYQIQFFKSSAKMNNGTYPFTIDTLQYSCIELTRLDSNYLWNLNHYKTRSPSAPEFWLTISVEDSLRIVRSNWHLCESTGKSYKFYFAYDAFDLFQDSVKIWLSYPGWDFNREFPLISFSTANFLTIKKGLAPVVSNAEKATNKWFNSRGLKIGITEIKEMHNKIDKQLRPSGR